ncbi:GRAM domain-containing protein [Psychroserpens sp.]|uniref:GRAM domain-containing protein n=1 Tax=Psychroserpens sp. TaxID=2020870 RepID=UPI001B0BDF63|nr:GRAM domain-containing protein [Psychroserpens sp.]MBO6606104.1 hypothetical protein [Psychroserpens sp.]MBO6630612.1 hypothetical protein [Psychroserpens sp.]MBO6652525.1 hypothetical protein [Psychroserpens sp.]MBO6681703.1 hypothetical protein [Psychroserpens sp.]MBO6749478.1 hypothetical protein [Psychroserpens sp.]
MEIGNKPLKMGWKYGIGFALFSAIIYTLLLLFFNSVSNNIDYSVSEMLIQGAIFGLLFVIIFPLVMKLFGKKLSNSDTLKIIPVLESDEEIEIHGPANMFRGIEGVGGKLFLTNKNIIFKSHKINIQTGQTAFDYNDIKGIETLKTLNLINNRLRITTVDDNSHVFVVNERDLWLKHLQERIEL